jgi:hypothetical protein
MGKIGFVTVLAIVAAAAVAFAVRPSAAISRAQASDPRVPVLQKQVRTLQTQLKVLQKRVGGVEDQIALNFEGDTCLAGQSADLIQGTWGVVDQIGQALQQKTYFGSQTPVDDFGNCADLAQPDVPRPGIRVPPTIDPLRPLAQWLHE